MSKKLSPDLLQKIAISPWIKKVLVVAVEFEIFSNIKKANTAIKMAKKFKANAGTIERLLNACVALGFLEKDKDVYKNTPISEKFLVKGIPSYYGDFLLNSDETSKMWDYLRETVVRGVPPRKKLVNYETPIFTRAMHNNAQAPAKVLTEKLDLVAYKNLLDLGGGSGAYSIALAKSNKKLKATIFELPKVCKTAREYVKKFGDASRIDIVAGDYLKDRLPSGFDVVLMSQVLHTHSALECRKLIKKVCDMLPINGLIVVNEFLLNPDRTGPVFPALFSLNILLATGEGNAYTKQEITSWLEPGFKVIKTFPLVGPHSVIVTKKVA